MVPPPSRMILEVLVPSPPTTATHSLAASSQVSSDVELDDQPPKSPSTQATSDFETTAETSEAVESESESEKPRLRKRTGRVPMVILDDDSMDEASDVKPKAKSKAKPSRPSKAANKKAKKSAASSDYEDDDFKASESGSEPDDDAEEEEDDDFIEDESEPVAPKKSKKPAKKPSRPAKKGKPAASSDVEDEMDVDVPKKPQGKKRKSEAADDKPAKKQKLREETDPWKLKTKAVKEEWTKMHAPPLEMFHFERLVIDEYTYLDGKILSMVQKLTATRRWVLSGTPPIHDFTSLKTIAAFLDIHLGVDDDGEGQSAQVKKRRREQTGAWPATSG